MRNKKDIYILLTDTGTLLNRLIKLYTKAPFNHASISFDRELKEVYSFGRKKPWNPFIGGFVKENLCWALFARAKCAVYSCSVDADTYDGIMEDVQSFCRDSSRYSYNLLGLFGVIFNKDFKRENTYFCSQFVAFVLQHNGIDPVGKPSAFTTPGDFEKSERLKLVYSGNLCEYKADLLNVRESFRVKAQAS